MFINVKLFSLLNFLLNERGKESVLLCYFLIREWCGEEKSMYMNCSLATM